MLELSDDNSDLARIQRDDTKEQLGFLNPERIKFVVPKSLIICFFVVALISIAMNAIAVFTQAVGTSGEIGLSPNRQAAFQRARRADFALKIRRTIKSGKSPSTTRTTGATGF